MLSVVFLRVWPQLAVDCAWWAVSELMSHVPVYFGHIPIPVFSPPPLLSTHCEGLLGPALPSQSTVQKACQDKFTPLSSLSTCCIPSPERVVASTQTQAGPHSAGTLQPFEAFDLSLSLLFP